MNKRKLTTILDIATIVMAVVICVLVQMIPNKVEKSINDYYAKQERERIDMMPDSLIVEPFNNYANDTIK